MDFKRHAILALGVALAAGAAGCDSQQPAALPDEQRTSVLTPDSGVVRDRLGEARWRSVVESGQVRAIEERVALYGALVGERRYVFDSLGRLRQVTERMDVGTAAAGASQRNSLLEFRAGLPVLATRDANGNSAPFARGEMRRLEGRGYALFDSASHALPR